MAGSWCKEAFADSTGAILTRRAWLGCLILSGGLAGCAEWRRQPPHPRQKEPDFTELAKRLEELRQRYAVPGLSAAVSRGGEVVWAAGMGLRHREANLPAEANTVYHIASLTKPFAAVLIAQAAQEGRLSLEAPVSDFGIKLPNREIRVWHLLSHTSEGTPGQAFRYNSTRYKLLEDVIKGATGRSFAAELSRRVLEPLGLRQTSPNPLDPKSCQEAGRSAYEVKLRMAQGYAPDGRTPVPYRDKFSPATGLVSTCADVLRFTTAVHEGNLLQPEMRERLLTPPMNARGEKLPYALGWFVQPSRYGALYWHYGWWTGCSSLLVAVPRRRLAFVVLANSEGLSRQFDLGKHLDVRRSPFAQAFFETCVV